MLHHPLNASFSALFREPPVFEEPRKPKICEETHPNQNDKLCFWQLVVRRDIRYGNGLEARRSRMLPIRLKQESGLRGFRWQRNARAVDRH